MDYRFAKRMARVPRSFIREILKVTVQPEIISFAGGLPNAEFFPVQEISDATARVLAASGPEVLQYSTTEGYLPLRQYIVDRYREREGLNFSPDQVLITGGSQQGLDLLGKVLLDDNDSVVIEKPGYLGAIQALSAYCPRFHDVVLEAEGMNAAGLRDALQAHDVKMIYTVTNFQNPTGITYTAARKKELAALIRGSRALIIEDNPYGELRFLGEEVPSIAHDLPEQSILLGSFSKVVAPALRLGWVVAPPVVMDKLIVAKQATDLHTNYFAQRVLFQYLSDCNLDQYIARIREGYRGQRSAMIDCIRKYFPPTVKFTEPEGGMFLWVTLPPPLTAMDLLERAIARNVAFVPGLPFYANTPEENTLRLNYTNSNPDVIETGIRLIGEAIRELQAS